VHRLRIGGKQLRALLVPWLSAVPEASSLFAIATRLQDQIGDARDAHLLAECALREALRRPEHGVPLRALAAALEARAAQAHTQVQAEWLGDGADGAFAALLAAVSPAASALCARAAGDLEIERKYLLNAVPPRLEGAAGIRIAQGWLPGERLRERLRRSVHPDGRVQWTRTVKVGTGVSRLELEEETPAVLFETLWPLTARERVEKVRHAVPDGALTWEIDVFLDRELVLAEIELPSADTAVSFPAWLAPYVVRDVTGDPAFVNANLARALRPVSSS
jgi:CYTH domain-containing protein